MEAPGKGKKLLKRAVVRVITPGTLTDTAYLSGGANNYLLAVATQGGAIGVALLDVSTGEFVAGEDAPPPRGGLAAAPLPRPRENPLSPALRGRGGRPPPPPAPRPPPPPRAPPPFSPPPRAG